jgi:chromosome partitioning protein
VAEAPSHGLPVLLYDKNSRGAQAYLALAGEILRRDEQLQPTKKEVAITAELREDEPVN